MYCYIINSVNLCKVKRIPKATIVIYKITIAALFTSLTDAFFNKFM